MKNGFRVLDCDLHLIESFDLWKERMPAGVRDQVEISITSPNGALETSAVRFRLGGKQVDLSHPFVRKQSLARMQEEPHLGEANRACSPSVYDVGLDAEGIDTCLLVPTLLLFLSSFDGIDPALSLAVNQAYNDWAAEFCRHNPERYKFYGWLPRHDPALAVREARRCVDELGCVALGMTMGAVDGRLLADPVFEPLWQALNEMNVPLGLHGFADNPALKDVNLRYWGHPESYVAQQAMIDIYHAMASTAELITGGVLDRYPNIRPILFETGASWLAWFLWRLDAKWNTWGRHSDIKLSMKPSEYFRRQCFASLDCDEAPVTHLIEMGLEDNLMLSTDYPHHDCDWPEAIATFLAQPELDDSVRRKILWDNGAKLFGLDVAAPSAAAARL